MLDPHDHATETIPGVPPLPAPVPRTNQAQRRAELGYQGPKERPRCEACTYCTLHIRNPDQLNEEEVLRCDQGDFPVHRGGMCFAFKPAKPAE